ncbi:hypothetical protein [Geobacter sulfurreducens]|uniref:hypothetical protein n=1 Tax=Geobacter sulfurreducens TaxID=35554 RepID=UPI002C59671A|nr:hypothetical protein [Geobacter sulfurreducens]HML79802.1 hypothetical protein [Geobacter sulfurreducens]
MTIGKKIQEMAVWIEFLVGSGLAIFFHLVLHYEQAAYVIFGIGILLALVTYLIREDIEKNRAHLVEQYHQAHEIPFAMASITDPECLAKAHELIAGTRRTITILQQGYIPLDENEFYLEGAKLSDQTVREIRAVDPLTVGWWTRGALVNFYQANLRALDRGVRIRRIFVVNREELGEPEVQKVLLSHYRDDIDIRIVYRDELPAAGDIIGRDTNSSFDFALYDDRVATDVFAHPGKYYGRKTAQPMEVAKYRHLYDLIEHSAHAVSEDGDRIVPSAEVMPLAS